MISNFELKNQYTGVKVTLGMDDIYDYIYKEDGLDWGSVPGNHNTYTYPGQNGESIYNSNLKTRDISITGYVYYRLTEEERNNVPKQYIAQYIHEKLQEKKKVLNDIINPLEFVMITIGDYFIEGKPANSIIYGKDRATNNEYFCQFLITIFCANPMFRKTSIVKNVLHNTYGVFNFPFIIPNDIGYVMSTRENYLMLSVENEGNVDIGGIITLIAKGEVKNPELEKIETGEIIRINKTMVKGERIIINTNPGKNRGIVGIVNGVESDYLPYWSYANSWFSFKRGISLIGYSTQNGAELNLDVRVEFSPEKFSLEDM